MTATIDSLARFVSGLRLEDVPARVVEKARLQQASVIAAGLAARLDGGARKATAAVQARSEPGPARLLAAPPARASLPGAIFANAAASCAFDFDEILLIGHPGHSTAVVPLGFADARPGLTAGDLLRAQIAGNEVGARLGLACFFGPQNGQHLPFIHLVGAAAAASALLELDAERTADALAIALAQPPAALWPSFLGAIESKVLTAAHPAEIGTTAALLAKEGMSGPRAILDHERGFFHRFAFLPLRGALTGLGRAWLTDTMQLKTHAACWYFQAPLDAAAEALRRLGRPRLAPGDVKRIRCGATLLGASVNALARGVAAGAGDRISPNTMNFRLDLSLALFLLAGRLSPHELDEAALAARGGELRALAAKIEVVHDLAETRRTVGAVAAALDLPALAGGAGIGAFVGALSRARHEFRGMPGPNLGDAVALARDALSAAFALLGRRDRRGSYDLGERSAQIADLAVPCGGTLEIELADGTRIETAAAVPAGALGADLVRGRALAERKLALGMEIAGAKGSAGRALGVALDAPGASVLDAVFG